MTPLRIMIAEDEAVIALLLGEVLSGLGYTICATVATEDEAVAAALAHRPDLIIMDAGLQDGSGIAAVETINAAHPTPYIFSTGDAAHVRKFQPNAVILEKPFVEAELIAAIERATGLGQ